MSDPVVVRSVEDVLDIQSVLAFAYFGREFVALLRRRLCTDRADEHTADTPHGGENMVVPSIHASVAVDEEFIDAAQVALGYCQELLRLGLAGMRTESVEYVIGVLRRTIEQAGKSLFSSSGETEEEYNATW